MNVTYLLGAGASCECLPTYKNFKTRFSQFLYFLFNQKGKIDPEYSDDLSELTKILGEIDKEFVFHNTPDTIAKKYFHLNDTTRLDQLKNSLILFFLFEQITKDPPIDNDGASIKNIIDKRYDSFIAGLLKPIPKRLELIENINILSWNYDLQFEIAFSRYLNASISKVQDHIQSFPKILPQNIPFTKNKFSLIHLNGIAYARPDSHHKHDHIGFFINRDEEMASYLIQVYHALHTINTQHEIGGNRLLTFAWENLNEDYKVKLSPTIENAMLVAEDTEVLVINGYSFPVFNRSIDRQLFEKMDNLDKVYIQSPQAKDIENIIKGDLLENKGGIGFFDLGYWNQFYIPSEWSKKKPELYGFA
jgi:hypothetical protein